MLSFLAVWSVGPGALALGDGWALSSRVSGVPPNPSSTPLARAGLMPVVQPTLLDAHAVAVLNVASVGSVDKELTVYPSYIGSNASATDDGDAVGDIGGENWRELARVSECSEWFE